MKFSDFSTKMWSEYCNYFDTCLIPITGLKGSENPYETHEKLIDLGKLISPIEDLYNGRIVTYPALHFMDEISISSFDSILLNLKRNFKFIITASTIITPISKYIDIYLEVDDLTINKKKIEDMWLIE